jgi:hypothetical protein|tara:strand:- start:4980 stop:5303 length:324 start_codon:yes stop_codon:yes gene_type:complete
MTMVGRPSKKIICGARRKYDGNPCQCKALPSGRCKFHGGMSTGQQTLQGRIKALKNLLPFKHYSDEQIKQIIKRKNIRTAPVGRASDEDFKEEGNAITLDHLQSDEG